MKLKQAVLVTAFLTTYIPAARAQEHTIGELSWLEGCWMTSGTRTVEENWTAPRGGSMIGVGRTVRDGKLIAYELVILKEKDGTVVYEAHPSGQETTEFRAREITGSTAVFENLEHDFPQRVCYRLTGTDSLLSWVEGTINGQEKRIEFPYTRVVCPGCGAN